MAYIAIGYHALLRYYNIEQYTVLHTTYITKLCTQIDQQCNVKYTVNSYVHEYQWLYLKLK